MIQFPDKDRATLREVAVFNADDETHRKAILSALFRTFWQIEDGQVEWWQAQSEMTELSMDRGVMARVARADCLRVPVDLPDDEGEAFGYLATLDYADYTESFCSAYIDRLMLSRKDFEETVRNMADAGLRAAENAKKSRRGRETVEARHGPARQLLRCAGDDAVSLWNTGDSRDHIQITDCLLAKELPGGAKPYATLNRNGLIKHLKSRLYELDRLDLVKFHAKWCEAGHRSSP